MHQVRTNLLTWAAKLRAARVPPTSVGGREAYLMRCASEVAALVHPYFDIIPHPIWGSAFVIYLDDLPKEQAA